MIVAEFSRTFAVDTLHGSEATRTIEAKPAECERVAQRFEIPAISSLNATLAIRPRPHEPGHYEVEGQAVSLLTLTCSVSGEDFLQEITAPVRAVFIAGRIAPHTEDMAIDFTWDDPEPVVDGVIDLGELVVQQIFLALPAYPRKPDASWSGLTDDDLPESPRESPFAILKRRPELKT